VSGACVFTCKIYIHHGDTPSDQHFALSPPPHTTPTYSKSIISVFGRLDELAANVFRNTTVVSDSSMHGLDELFLWYALDNRRGLQDPGVKAYRDKLQQLCEERESANQHVPLDLLRFLDAFSAL
jgi:hypothetical protein